MAERSKQERIKEPINLDDYKLLSKALKLKILKQSKIIEQLEATCKVNAQLVPQYNKAKTSIKQTPSKYLATPSKNPQRSDIQIDSLTGKKQVITVFANNAQKFGISPESIFRIIDIDYRGEVDSDTFRKSLMKINLNLSPKEVSCLIYIFDENCSGTITRQQFTDALQAYQVSSESQHASYMNQSLNKLANLMQQSNINFKKFYEEMEMKSKKNVTLDIFGTHIKTTFPNKIQQKQIVAAFNQIDLENDNIVDRQNFIYGIQSSLNKQIHDRNVKQSSDSFQQLNQISGIKKPSNQTPNNFESNLSYKSGRKGGNQDQLQPNKESIINIKVPASEINPNDLFNKYLHDYKIDLNKIYEELSGVPMPKRMTLYSFKKAINQLVIKKSGIEVSPEHISHLFKLIDSSQKGSIGFSELIYFYLQHGSDISIIFRLIGKYFSNNDLNAEKFFYLFGINADADISKMRFVQIFSKTFISPNSNINSWDKLWNYFDKGRGVQSVAYIIKEMEKYQIR